MTRKHVDGEHDTTPLECRKSPPDGRGVLVLLNPAAGGGRGARVWRELEPRVRARFGGFELFRTRGPGEAEALARSAAKAAGLTLVVGGDGTVHEAVNGLLAEADSGRLAVIPAGSGNDFARNLNLPLDPNAAFDRLGNSGPRRVDVGHCGFRTAAAPASRLFVNSLSVGVSANANRIAHRLGRGVPGWLRYPLAGVLALLREGPASYRISSGGRQLHAGPALSLTVANGASFGAGLLISPTSEPDDGSLELLLIGPLRKMRALLALARLRRGTHLAMPGVMTTRLQAPVTIAPDDLPVLLEADGEILSASSELTISILPRRLLLCN